MCQDAETHEPASIYPYFFLLAGEPFTPGPSAAAASRAAALVAARAGGMGAATPVVATPGAIMGKSAAEVYSMYMEMVGTGLPMWCWPGAGSCLQESLRLEMGRTAQARSSTFRCTTPTAPRAALSCPNVLYCSLMRGARSVARSGGWRRTSSRLRWRYRPRWVLLMPVCAVWSQGCDGMVGVHPVQIYAEVMNRVVWR